MKYLVVLGNPGDKYKKTIHNVAWMIADQLDSSNWKFEKYMNAKVTKHLGYTFIQPQTFMNKSGESLAFLVKKGSLVPEELVVMYDDLDLPLGKIRVSSSRGSGGHNGIKSIIQHLGSKDFVRIRVGVSPKGEEGNLQKPSVLSNFGTLERRCIESTVSSRVKEILLSLQSQGLQKTMNQYNAK